LEVTQQRQGGHSAAGWHGTSEASEPGVDEVTPQAETEPSTGHAAALRQVWPSPTGCDAQRGATQATKRSMPLCPMPNVASTCQSAADWQSRQRRRHHPETRPPRLSQPAAPSGDVTPVIGASDREASAAPRQPVVRGGQVPPKRSGPAPHLSDPFCRRPEFNCRVRKLVQQPAREYICGADPLRERQPRLTRPPESLRKTGHAWTQPTL
jgi:hypothetical protein